MLYSKLLLHSAIHFEVPGVDVGVVLVLRELVEFLDQGFLGDLENFDLGVGVVKAKE